MTGYLDFYQETARAFHFAGDRRLVHKLAGARPVKPHENWIAAAEDAAWPIIYQWHYLRERGGERPAGPPAMRQREDPEFVERLAAADGSAGVVEPGWTVISRDGAGVVCERDGLRLRVPDGPEPGEVMSVRFPAGRRYWMPGYYSTGGGMATAAELRIYFHVKPDWAAWLLGTVSRTLAQYQFKVLNHPQRYTRPDAAVLYLDGAGLEPALALVGRIAASGVPAFRARVPEMTLRLESGIAVADEPPAVPGRRMSFGEHRCRTLARAIARSHAEGLDRLESIHREFALQGLDAARPYAAAGRAGMAGAMKLRYHQTGVKTA